MSLPAELLKFAAANPELVGDAVELARSLVAGRSGVRELSKLKRSADAERRRRAAIVAAAKRR